jgi:hypothetical protein
MARRLSKSDLTITVVTSIVGIALTYVLLSSVYPTRKLDLRLLSLVGIALGCTSLFIWHLLKRRHFHKYGRTLMRETVIVDGESSAEIIFSPKKPIENPVLLLRSYGKSDPVVMVDNIWRNGDSIILSPHPIETWRCGVAYPGFLNMLQDPIGDRVQPPPLKILVRNASPRPVAVYAHISELPHTTHHKD